MVDRGGGGGGAKNIFTTAMNAVEPRVVSGAHIEWALNL